MIALMLTMRARRGEGQLQGMCRGPRTPDASGVLAGLCSRGREVLEVRWKSRINSKGVIEKNVPGRIWSASH